MHIAYFWYNFRVQWYGSFPNSGGDTCSADLKGHTRDSTDKTRYRHFAYDSIHEIVYFCDLNPYKEGMFCYCSDRRNVENNGSPNVWNGK